MNISTRLCLRQSMKLEPKETWPHKVKTE